MPTYTKTPKAPCDPRHWRDIVEWEKQSEFIESLEEKWLHLWENSTDCLVEIDLDFNITAINWVLPCYKKEDVLGTNVFEYVHKSSHKDLQTSIDALLKTRKPQEYLSRVETPAGTSWWKSRLLPLQRDCKIRSILFIATNVTESIEKDEKISRLEEELKELKAK